MDSLDWPDRPATSHFGPASWQSSLLALLSAIFVRPVLAALTLLGLIVNRFCPEAMQRARLGVIDEPLRLSYGESASRQSAARPATCLARSGAP